MSKTIKEQFETQTWAVTSDYSEVLPYLDNPSYLVANTFRSNGLFDVYYVGLK
jgi:hypothetical protein